MGIEKFQNRATRIVNNNKFDASSRPLIERLGWKTIEELIAKESKTIVYNALYGLTPQYLYHPFVRNFVGEARPLRNTSTDLKIPKKSYVNGQKRFSYHGVKLWSSLLTEAKTASTLGTFKIYPAVSHCHVVGIILFVNEVGILTR